MRVTRKQFFVQRALRRQSAKKAAACRKAQRAMLAAAGWKKQPDRLTLIPDSALDDSIDDLFGESNG